MNLGSYLGAALDNPRRPPPILLGNAGRTVTVGGREIPLPGPISGYGGGTWNLDGTQATPVDRLGGGDGMPTPPGQSPQLPAPGDRLGDGMEGMWGGPLASATASGFPALPDGPPASPSGLPGPTASVADDIMAEAKPRGIFGSPSLPRRTAASSEPSPGSVSIMPPLPAMPGRRGVAQPFDYDAALAAMLPPKPKKNLLRDIAGVLGPTLMAMGGNQAGANAAIAQLQARRNARETQQRAAINAIERWRHDDYARRQGADLRAANPFTIGRDRLQYDPQTGEVATIYDGPEPFEQYAGELGLEPGTPEYFEAVEDYVLRANGPSAYQRDVDLDDYRTGNRLKVEGVRQGNRLGLEGVRQGNRITTRQTPSYRDTHPAPARSGGNGARTGAAGGAGNPVKVSTPAEAQKLTPGTVYQTPDGRVKVR